MLDGMEVLAKRGAPRLSPNKGEYLPGWALRCYLVMIERRQGVESMKWDGIRVRALGHMNPDQKDWFSPLEQHVNAT